MPMPAPAAEPVQITVVESDACHLCDDAQQVLAGFAARYPLEIVILDVRSGSGQELMVRHRAPMSPLVLVDGGFFSSGRLPRRKLEKVLSSRYGHAGTSAGVVGESHHG